MIRLVAIPVINLNVCQEIGSFPFHNTFVTIALTVFINYLIDQQTSVVCDSTLACIMAFPAFLAACNKPRKSTLKIAFSKPNYTTQ